MKKLSKQEMKNVTGGVAQCNCTCEGGTGGAWQYNYDPQRNIIDDDISNYCSTGAATCNGCSHIGD